MIDAIGRMRLRMAIRRVYFMSDARTRVLARCRTSSPRFKKDGTPAMRGGRQMKTHVFKCEVCGTDGIKSTKFQVDHISPVGPTPGSRDAPHWWTWDIFIKRMFDSSNMQGICSTCHDIKTPKDKEDIRSGKLMSLLKHLYVKEEK